MAPTAGFLAVAFARASSLAAAATTAAPIRSPAPVSVGHDELDRAVLRRRRTSPSSRCPSPSPSRSGSRPADLHGPGAEGHALPARALPDADDESLEVHYTITNLDAQSHAVWLLIDPWNEFVRWKPGRHRRERRGDDAELGLRPAVPACPASRASTGTSRATTCRRSPSSSRRSRTCSQAPRPWLPRARRPARRGATTTPRRSTRTASTRRRSANNIMNPQNRSNCGDPLFTPWIPPVIAGLTGFDLGLRPSSRGRRAERRGAPNVAIEITMDVQDLNGNRFVAQGSGAPHDAVPPEDALAPRRAILRGRERSAATGSSCALAGAAARDLAYSRALVAHASARLRRVVDLARGRSAARSPRPTRSCRAATSGSTRARRRRRRWARRARRGARTRKDARFASRASAMPFSVMYTGSPLRFAHVRTHVAEALRVDLPSRGRSPRRRAARRAETKSSAGVARREADDVARVVVDAEEVLRAVRLGHPEPVGPTHDARAARTCPSHAADRERVVEDAREERRRGAVAARARALGLDDPQVCATPTCTRVARARPSARGRRRRARASRRCARARRARGLFFAGGQTPSRYACAASTFGSLTVTHSRHRSPSASTATRAKRASRAANPSASTPPRSASHVGSVKWCSVTIGSIPASRRRAEHRAVLVERGAIDLALRAARSAPTRPTCGTRPCRAPAAARRPPASAATSRTPRRGVAVLDAPRLARERRPVARRATPLDLRGRRRRTEEEPRREAREGGRGHRFVRRRSGSSHVSVTCRRWAGAR